MVAGVAALEQQIEAASRSEWIVVEIFDESASHGVHRAPFHLIIGMRGGGDAAVGVPGMDGDVRDLRQRRSRQGDLADNNGGGAAVIALDKAADTLGRDRVVA